MSWQRRAASASCEIPTDPQTNSALAGEQAAKGVAATIKSFQPTIREVTEVTSELRTNLSQEMGIDELQREFRDIERTTRESMSLTNPMQPPPPIEKPKPDPAPQSTLVGKEVKPQAAAESALEQGEQRALSEISAGLAGLDDSAAAAPLKPVTEAGALAEDPEIERKRAESAKLAWGGNVPQEIGATDAEAAAAGGGAGKGEKKRLQDMTMAELEAELAKRKALAAQIEQLDA